LVDRRVLVALAAELEDLPAALAVADRYRANLAHRLARLDRACADGDLDAAMDAVLSLKVGSATVGATRMQGYAESLESALRAGGCRDAESALARVRGCAPATLAALNRALAHHRGRQSAAGSSIR
jgi:HPt (histidine-containing phosphotransfer) domain-containing protein